MFGLALPVSHFLKHFALRLLCLVTAVWSGCALLHQEQEGRSRSPLPPIVAPRDAVELEVFIVDRTVGDPLIGSSLWNSLHEVTALTPEQRQKLSEQGFRLAMCPSRPPQAVQALLALSDTQDPTRRTLFQRLVIPAGQPTMMPVTVLPPEVELDLSTQSGVQRKTLTQGSCHLQVQAEKVSEGWAKVEFQPILMHGAAQLRPRGTAEEWQFEQGQQTITLYDQRFHVELNEGELVVVGFSGQGDHSVGRRFFRGEWKNVPVERLLLIRLRGMHRVEPIRSE